MVFSKILFFFFFFHFAWIYHRVIPLYLSGDILFIVYCKQKTTSTGSLLKSMQMHVLFCVTIIRAVLYFSDQQIKRPTDIFDTKKKEIIKLIISECSLKAPFLRKVIAINFDQVKYIINLVVQKCLNIKLEQTEIFLFLYENSFLFFPRSFPFTSVSLHTNFSCFTRKT